VIAACTIAAATALLAEPDEPGITSALRIARPAEPESSFSRDYGPAFKLGLRRFVLPDQAATESEALWGTLDFYVVSRWIRVGMGAAGGVGRPRNDIYALGNLTAGLQWPARVTPFVEFGLGGGLTYRAMLAGQLFWMHTLGVDAGIEVYLTGDFYLSAAAGWMRPVVHGAAAGQDLYYDTFAMKLGLGF
jgi:hypothetical protein